jgi:hypothetical protein
VSAAQNGNATLAPILEHCQFLGQGVDPAERRKI